MNEHDKSPDASTRRDFLQQAAGLATGAALVAAASGADAPGASELLPTVKLGPHTVTRLILGGNPIYGHSHFNRLFSEHMRTYHTLERVQELIERAVKAGINTWQNSYAEP